MLTRPKKVALVPMRGGSKSIPKKNIKLLNGKPLFYWSIKSLLESNTQDKVFISTDCDEITLTVKELFPEVSFIKRPNEIATDTASTESAINHFLENVDCEILTLVQVTSPLTSKEDFYNAHESFDKNGYDSLLTGVINKNFFWDLDTNKSINYDYQNRPRRQDFQGQLLENGAFYIFKSENFLKYQNRLSGKIGYHIMDEFTAFEIDEPSDFLIIENIMKEKS